MKPLKYILPSIAVAIGAFLVAQSASAATITVDMGSYGVGYITPTVIPPTGVNTTILGNMITVYNSGSSPTLISGETYTIDKGSSTPAPNLPPGPSSLIDTGVSGSPTSFNVDLGAGGAGNYLIAQWDGPNGADAVYYIAGLTGIITLQNTTDFVNHQGGAYGLSGVWTANSVTVPDGGTTLALLGFALVGVESLRRKIFNA